MAARKQSSLTIDEAFQRFYRQEKGGPHVACEQFNQALREGLPLWVVDPRPTTCVIGPAVGAERCGVAAPVIAVRTPETRRTKSGTGVPRGGFSVQ
jgi:hypothetical protein